MTSQTSSISVANRGINAVRKAFSDLGWPPLSNSEFDIGTDLWVLAADSRGEPLDRLLGVQVKTGKSYFREPGEQDGKSGWWYRESDWKHFNSWLKFNVPHLIVLHDLERGASYWAHINGAAVISTGKGCKVFVPEPQTIDFEHCAALCDVAMSKDYSPSFEGSVIGLSFGEVPKGCELRYALIAPRTVAPHPNLDSDRAISATEGVALLMQGRFSDLKYRSERHSEVPDPEEPGETVGWAWRFVAAIWDWATTDSVTSLETVVDSAPDKRSVTSSCVFLACAFGRLDRHRDAVNVLEHLVSDEELDPIDRAWVLVHWARINAEIGNLKTCRSFAQKAYNEVAAHNDDITARAIAASALRQLWISAKPGDLDFRPMLSAADTLAYWWRSQRAGWGLSKAVEAGFQNWAQDQSVSIGGSRNFGVTDLFGAEVCADLAADHFAWKDVVSLSGRLRIQHAEEANDTNQELTEGLTSLRLSGDDKSLRLAFGRLLWDGPLEVAAGVVSQIRPGEWTRTTITSNFALLEVGGEFLDEDTTGEMLTWLCSLVEENLEAFIERYEPSVFVLFASYKAMAGLMPAAASSYHSRVANFIASQRRDLPNVVARQLADSLNWLDPDSVGEAGRDSLRRIAFGEQSYIGTRILGWLAANGDAEAINRLKLKAIEGDLEALARLSDVRHLDRAQAKPLISLLEGRARQVLSEAQEGRYNSDSMHILDALTLLNLQFPSVSQWPTVLALLYDPIVLADQKSTICERLAKLSELVPASERDSIIANIDSIATAKEGFWPGANLGGIEIVLAIAFGAITEVDADAAVMRLALGNKDHRVNAAMLLGLGHCGEMRPILTQLIQDRHPEVRIEAARSVGKLAVKSPNQIAYALARHIAQANGTLLQLGLLSGISQEPGVLGDRYVELISQLQSNKSARIRQQSKKLVEA